MQDLETEIVQLSPTLSYEKILHSMGIPQGKPIRKRLTRLIEESLLVATEIARPKLAWAIAPSDVIKTVLGNSIRIERYLNLPKTAALAIGTVGSEWEHFVMAEDDPMKAYVYTAIATALARDTLVKARRELSQRYPEMKIADSLSPGTDRLPHTLQTRFAATLPLEDIGVTFDPETYFMHPLATVTAIIAFGSAVEREHPLPECGEVQPRCSRCPDRNCQLRIVPFVSTHTEKQTVSTV